MSPSEFYPKLMRIAVGCLIITVGSVIAKPAASQTVSIIGTGAGSCGTWNQHRDNQFATEPDRQWVLGYLAGIAVWEGKDLMRSLDYGAVVSWMDRYCYQHPLTEIGDAAADLARELMLR